MDRDRLKQVHKTELTEGRVNEPFVHWLKTKGPTYLLVVMLVIAGYLGYVRWRERAQAATDGAWIAVLQSRLPATAMETAETYKDTFAVPLLAWRGAATMWLGAVQMDRPLDADPQAQNVRLTPEMREEYLDSAEGAFKKIVAADDGSEKFTLHAIGALNGLAAVAECRGQVDEARAQYEKAAQRAEKLYPALAAQARRRAETADRYLVAPLLPAQADLAASQNRFTPSMLQFDTSLQDLLDNELADDETPTTPTPPPGE